MQRATLLTLFFCLFLVPAAFAQVESPADMPDMKRAPVEGGELEYEVRGDGEPVLLIHGSHIAASFLPIMDEPSLANYRLIRYHRRGLAGSTDPEKPFSIKEQAADARALLRHLGIERSHVVGHSYGGVIALQLALDAPEVVHSLVLLEPADLRPENVAPSEEMRSAIERYRAGDPTGAVDEFLRWAGGPEWRTKIARTVPGGPEQAERDARTFFEVEVPALRQWEFGAEQAEKISQPTRMIHTPAWIERKPFVHELFPEVDYHVVEGVTHSLQIEDPRTVAEGIAGFLRRHPLDERSNQGYVLKRNEGEVLLEGGIIVKASPQQGAQGGEMVLQTMTPGFSTGRHVHLRADEFFYVVSGSGSAFLGDNREVPIEGGDVVFVPKGHDHKLVNTASDQPLKLIFFLDKPGLAETFRKMHQRFQVSGQPMTLDRLNEIAQKYGTVFKTLE